MARRTDDGRTMLTACARLAPRPDAAHHARRTVAAAVAGHVDPKVVPSLQLITTELVTNALKHGSQEHPVWLHVKLAQDEVAVTVSGVTNGTGPDATMDGTAPSPFAESGRGLCLVRALTDAFSVFRGSMTVVRAAQRL